MVTAAEPEVIHHPQVGQRVRVHVAGIRWQSADPYPISVIRRGSVETIDKRELARDGKLIAFIPVEGLVQAVLQMDDGSFRNSYLDQLEQVPQ